MNRTFANNARGLLVILVMAGHLLESQLAVSGAANSAYILIYAFHMPALAALSGAATRNHFGKDEFANTIIRLLQPLIICQLLFLPLEMVLADPDKQWHRYSYTPYWVLWYLLSLGLWRLMLPVFMAVRFPLLSAVFIAVAAGAFSFIGYPLALSRTLVFFPFFLAGHLLLAGPRPVQMVRSGRLALTAWLIIVAGAAIAVVMAQANFDPAILYHAKSYGKLGLDRIEGAATRMLLLAAAGALVWAVLTVLPTRMPALVERIGKHSLFCYLSHALLLKAAEAAGLLDGLTSHDLSWAYVAGSLIVSAGLGVALTLPGMQLLQSRLYVPFGRRRTSPAAASRPRVATAPN